MENYCGFQNSASLNCFFRSSSDHWSSISELHHKLKKMFKHNLEGDIEKDLQEKTGVMFAVTILFLQTVWEYCHVVNRLDSVCKWLVSYSLLFTIIHYYSHFFPTVTAKLTSTTSS